MRVTRNIVAGVLSGIGVVVLLQQYSVLYPTGTVAILGVVLGVSVQFAVSALAPRRSPKLAVASPMSDVAVAEPVTDWADPAGMAEPVTEWVGPAGVETSTDAAMWNPTHRVPSEGLDAWPQPDGSMPPAARLDAGLEVRVEQVDNGWAHIVCENGWAGWVDERRLEMRP